MMSQPLGLIGAGNMAEALIRGWLAKQVCPAAAIRVADIRAGRLAELSEKYGIQAHAENQMVAAACSVMILAVKPQQAEGVLAGLRPVLDPGRHVIISIAAGLTTQWLEKAMGLPMKIVRVMPNTPASLLAGVSVFCLGRHAGPAEARASEALFSPVGLAMQAEENLMDAVTALSGSGPAYVFAFCEALASAGRELGMTADMAMQLAIQTLWGAARMLKETGKPAAELRQAVTSPGGTTAAALGFLEQAQFNQVILKAMQAARDRSLALSAAFGSDSHG